VSLHYVGQLTDKLDLLSFSEDPHLSGMMAAAYVNGLQENGVAATIKHFVGNDQEHERVLANSAMSERALREIYLYP
jgi:beta-glucosidase